MVVPGAQQPAKVRRNLNVAFDDSNVNGQFDSPHVPPPTAPCAFDVVYSTEESPSDSFLAEEEDELNQWLHRATTGKSAGKPKRYQPPHADDSPPVSPVRPVKRVKTPSLPPNVVRLLERSLCIDGFDEDSSIYSMSRAWAGKDSVIETTKGSAESSSKKRPTEDSRENGESAWTEAGVKLSITGAPLPEPFYKTGDTDPRVPGFVVPITSMGVQRLFAKNDPYADWADLERVESTKSPKRTSVMRDHLKRSSLLKEHQKRWKKIRHSWRVADAANQARFAGVLDALKATQLIEPKAILS